MRAENAEVMAPSSQGGVAASSLKDGVAVPFLCGGVQRHICWLGSGGDATSSSQGGAAAPSMKGGNREQGGSKAILSGSSNQ